MRKRIPIKNHYREVRLLSQRVWTALIVFLILFILLVVRLSYLQIYKMDIYKTLSTKNWLDLVPIEPTRGLIFDRNGILLAENIPVFSIDIIPMQAKDLQKKLSSIKEVVSLSEYDLHQFRKQLKQRRRFDEVTLKLRLTEEEVAKFTENQHRFPGFFIKARLIRHYPYDETFSHVIGYVGRINAQEMASIDTINYSASYYIGKLGIEKFYEKELHGEVGYQQVEIDATGKPIRVLKEIKSIPGKNIYLTIDSRLQKVAQESLANQKGALVAIDTKSGQVLSMVSKPGYDPNVFITGLNQKDYKLLQRSEERPLFNRALRGLYPPASTIKPYLAIGGLEYGVIDTEYTLKDIGWFQIRSNSHRYHDWKSEGHGFVNISKAIAVSCDTYFYEFASRMGINLMDEALSLFGFGSLTGIDLDEELSGILASPEWKLRTKGLNWYEGDTILAGIGQGLMQTTPLQLAVATSTLANRGKRYMPYLKLGEQFPGDNYKVQSPIPLKPINLQKKETWDTVIEAMQDVVSARHGTGYFSGFGRAKYSVAAKTGTAQIISRRIPPANSELGDDVPERLRSHHLLIAFAPVEEPKIALAVVTENSDAAIKSAKTVLDYFFNNLNKEPTLKNPPIDTNNEEN